MPGPETINTEQLREDLQSMDCDVVARAADALMAAGEHLDAAALAQTRACLVRARSGRRRVGLARSYLHLLDPEDGAREAEQLLRRDSDPEVRDEAYHALVDCGERAMPVLRALARSRDATVRWYAYRAARRIGGSEAIPLLIDGLSDEAAALRLLAASALVARREEALLPVLHALATRPPAPGFHRAARTVLKRVTPDEQRAALKPLLESLGGQWSMYDSGFIARRLLSTQPSLRATAG